ncbi:class II fructose-bisphosphate aldolase [Shouchella clausii]|uniref:Ketose-bisphosphate aldolase n=1 Tax=Shouchella clausii TaxID=79880 RepID=A0A268S288_SHOCL|nr:class II fructose-bisphosphate aldolase [Shouchella clausii]PAD43358.1 ketose-bisphosphate aldolase [Bacillus sp. 7520-S]SPT78578.1 fructose-bisphosphate aldolase [Niallia circulans]MBU8596776.1 class II fructose-bisphosphate aldolase [Shouchella clausii]MCM3551008.1 class II fructose-bisphosphate aldolase [Shouchella clausii]MCY1104174.1 class II fructose-bisphosphate aldolase [Shouchella clausii]
MYANLKETLAYAKERGIAVGAFNAHCLEMVPAMLHAAKETNLPIIIQTTAGTADYVGYDVFVAVVKTLAEQLPVPVTLHLDHATDFAKIKQAVDAGYSSVMFDGSTLPIAENIEKTLEVSAYAHPRYVSVEAELGIIGGAEDGVMIDSAQVSFTQPEEVSQFLQHVTVDALALSIGTTHGQYKSKANLQFDLLETIANNHALPLVLHGGTGVKDEDIQKCVTRGIVKINVGTELLIAWTRTAKHQFAKANLTDSLRNHLIPCNEQIKQVIKAKMAVFALEKASV